MAGALWRLFRLSSGGNRPCAGLGAVKSDGVLALVGGEDVAAAAGAAGTVDEKNEATLDRFAFETSLTESFLLEVD